MSAGEGMAVGIHVSPGRAVLDPLIEDLIAVLIHVAPPVAILGPVVGYHVAVGTNVAPPTIAAAATLNIVL